MTAPLSAATAPHYAWGEGCDGWHLCQAVGLSVIEERMPPGTFEDRHSHGTARQLFYVLDGALDLEVDGVEYCLTARQSLEVAPGQPHQAQNRSSRPTRFLVISNPPAQGDRIPTARKAAL